MKQIFSITILFLVFSFSAFAQTSPCPTISVSGGGIVLPGEPMPFSASVSDEAKNLKLEYLWTVSGGTIIEGAGSPNIKVEYERKDGLEITATVEIKGLPANCLNTMSETGSVIIEYIPRLVDEFGKLPNDEVRERIKALYECLDKEPNWQGYIINYGTDREITQREQQIRRSFTFLKLNKKLLLDINRLTIVRGGANPNGAGVWTKVWIVPPSSQNPEP